jgi:hypothetical protein
VSWTWCHEACTGMGWMHSGDKCTYRGSAARVMDGARDEHSALPVQFQSALIIRHTHSPRVIHLEQHRGYHPEHPNPNPYFRHRHLSSNFKFRATRILIVRLLLGCCNSSKTLTAQESPPILQANGRNLR